MCENGATVENARQIACDPLSDVSVYLWRDTMYVPRMLDSRVTQSQSLQYTETAVLTRGRYFVKDATDHDVEIVVC